MLVEIPDKMIPPGYALARVGLAREGDLVTTENEKRDGFAAARWCNTSIPTLILRRLTRTESRAAAKLNAAEATDAR